MAYESSSTLALYFDKEIKLLQEPPGAYLCNHSFSGSVIPEEKMIGLNIELTSVLFSLRGSFSPQELRVVSDLFLRWLLKHKESITFRHKVFI